MTPADISRLMADALPDLRPWSPDEVAEALSAPGAVTVIAPHGFALGRAVADEAELFAIAVHPDHRRAGEGARLLAAWERAAVARRAARLFLEVAVDNAPARGLYARGGWTEAGRRRAYYGPGRDALILTRSCPG
ncbi:MAG: GNAT family N-acetyltransferase [Rhodobacteraceae bacterium]|jgi:ribosomal-protein-alanine N-acetyltransferase|nr:GNAT family N-acetyltransferase [Paracoccaceae bacterium]